MTYSDHDHQTKTPDTNDYAHILFSRQAALTPYNFAICWHDTQLTYQQLEQKTNRLARLLISKDIQRGDRVVVMATKNHQNIIWLLAIFKMGATYIPININQPKQRIEAILNDCQPKCIVTDNVKKIPEELQYKAFDLKNDYLSEKYDNTAMTVPSLDDQMACIIYTCSLTGRPTGVMMKHAGLANAIRWEMNFFDIKPTDISAQFSVPSDDVYFSEVFPFLAKGASIHVIDDYEKFTPIDFFSWLNKEKITVCHLPSAYAQILFQHKWPLTPALKTLKLYGDITKKAPNQQLSFDIWNTYGFPETTMTSCCHKLYSVYSDPKQDSYISIGKPIAHVEAYVVNTTGNVIETDEIGELWIGGSGVAAGYLYREEQTNEKFIPNTFNPQLSPMLYKTGDLVKIHQDGNIEWIGQIENAIDVSGIRIQLNDIENVLAEFSDVSEVLVLSKETANHPKKIIAYLVPSFDKLRVPYQKKCLLSINDNAFIDVLTDDISKEGLALVGLNEKIPADARLKINIHLPGIQQSTWLEGNIVWQQGTRCGIQFQLTTEQQDILDRSIKYYLSTTKLIDVLQHASIKRNILKAVEKKLPKAMVPSFITLLPKFSLTFNGKIDWNALPFPNDYKLLLNPTTENTETELEKKLIQLAKRALHIDLIHLHDNFFECGGNSLAAAQFLSSIVEEFSVEIPARIFLNSPYLMSIAEYIKSNGKIFYHHTAIEESIKQDMQLTEERLPSTNKIDDKDGILIIGASEFMGAHILKALLKKNTCKIYCLIHPNELKSAAMYFVQRIEEFKLSNELNLSNRQIIIIEGNCSDNHLGLTLDKYESLAKKINIIYYCDTPKNLVAPYSTLRKNNVSSIKEIIHFSAYQDNKAIYYLSFSENSDHGNGQHSDCSHLTGGYAQTEWVAEYLLMQAKNRGHDITLLQCGNMMGDSNTGVVTTNNALLLLLKSCIQLGFAPNWERHISFLPVNFIATVFVQIASDLSEKNKTFHINNIYNIEWQDLIKWLNKYYPIQLCSMDEWKQKVMYAGPANAAYKLLPLYLGETETRTLSSSSTLDMSRILDKGKTDYPKINDVLLETYMTYLSRIQFFPRPTKKISLTEDLHSGHH